MVHYICNLLDGSTQLNRYMCEFLVYSKISPIDKNDVRVLLFKVSLYRIPYLSSRRKKRRRVSFLYAFYFLIKELQHVVEGIRRCRKNASKNASILY